MNKLVKTLAIIVLSFIVGYVLYLALNDNGTNADLVVKNTKQEDVSSALSETIEKPKEQISPQQKPVSRSSISPENSSEIAADDEKTNLAPAVDSSENHADEYYTLETRKETLIDWSVNHKNKLHQIFDENMPQSISSSMKSSLVNNNTMLNDPTVEQDTIEDDNWAFLMEQDIRAHITQHDLSAGFDILNISCKQLICDIVGIERQANSWLPIYRGFYSFPNIRFRSEGKKPKNIVRTDQGIQYIYAQIIFKPSNSA